MIESEATEPIGTDNLPPTSSASPAAVDTKKRGPLLDKPEKDAAKLADELWELDTKAHRRLSVQWEANKARRQGVRDVHVVRDSDEQQGWRLYVPIVNATAAPVPNKTDELGRRVIATLLVDEPKPDVLPATDTAEDVDAAEFASRVLESETGPAGLNLRAIIEGALDLAYSYASGFTMTWTDQYGGGHAPVQIQAHPLATTVDEAETGPPGSQPSGDLVLKYVMPDNTLSSSSAGAQRQWRPKVKKRLLNGNHVRFLPRQSRGIEDATGVVVTYATTFGELKARYEKVASMPADDQWAIVNWRPQRFKDLLPDGLETTRDTTNDLAESPSSEKTCFVRTVWMLPTPEYPEGCEACFVGGKFRISDGNWMLSYTDKEGKEHEDVRDLPIAQYRWMPDHQRGNPYGIAGAETVGPLDEIRGFLTAGVMEAIFKALNPNVAFPLGTIIQPEEWGRRDGTPIMYNGAVGTPWVESPPVMPQYVSEFMQLVDHWMDTASGLEEAAKGVNSPNVRSDAQAQTIIEQALVALAAVRHSIEDGYERDCRLVLQEFKQHFTAPQMIRYLSDDGAFKYGEWMGSDLSSTKDVRVRKGTFTMMSPTARAQYIDQLVQMQAIQPDEAIRLKRGAVDWITGQQDDRYYQRIKRQLAAWREGPTGELKAASEKYAERMQQMQAEMAAQGPQVDPATGQPVPPPQPPPDPMTTAAAAIFAPLPVDAEQNVALIRHKELALFMSTTRYATYPPAWQAGLVRAYEQSRQAAGIATVQEQQQAAQQQAQQQQQAEQAKQQGEMQRDQAKVQTEKQMSDMKMQAAERDDQLSQTKHEREMQKMAMQPLVAKNEASVS